MRSFQEQGALVNLSEWINTEQLQTDYIESFLDLASVDGDVHGIYYKTDLKSIVWYPVEAFEDNGYEIPQTWDELMALSQQIVDDGNGSPWCISMEHGDATGWVATDWIEDVLLRTAPVEVYDQWVAHEIPFDSPEVLEAAQIVESIWFNPDFVYGGTTGINNTFVGDTQNPMFAKGGPKCWLHKQAAWIPDFWPKDPATDEPLFTPGKDSAFFYLPPIEEEYGRPVLGAGDMFVMFEDRPEVRALMEFLATPEAAQAWIEAGGFVSPNQATPVDWYEAYPSSGLAEIMADSTALRFDASDTMLAEVGQGTFWSGMVDWVRSGGSNTEQVFDKIETGWPDI
jgi:alpha-glucoside transport system substrate-binding protein